MVGRANQTDKPLATRVSTIFFYPKSYFCLFLKTPVLERKEKRREEKNTKYSGHIVLQQWPRAVHSILSDQKCVSCLIEELCLLHLAQCIVFCSFFSWENKPFYLMFTAFFYFPFWYQKTFGATSQLNHLHVGFFSILVCHTLKFKQNSC